jgi:hypothetical protein
MLIFKEVLIACSSTKPYYQISLKYEQEAKRFQKVEKKSNYYLNLITEPQ